MNATRSVLSLMALAAASTTLASDLTPVSNANPKASGVVAPNVLSPELRAAVVVQGATPLENPAIVDSATGSKASHYGYLSNGPMVPAPGAVQAPGSNVEASKTEPDKNTYLILRGQSGPDLGYDYGHHFLFQGHEAGKGHSTRINLDADAAQVLLEPGSVNHHLFLFSTAVFRSATPVASRRAR